MRVRSLVALSMVLILTLVVPASGAASAQDPSPSDEKVVFTVGVDTDMVSPNPFAGGATGDYETFFNIYDQLLQFDMDTMEPAPGLAESWTRNEAGTEWTFKIRDGVMWSDGVPLTAHDVAWTYNFIISTPGNFFGSELGKKSNPTFTAPDDHTFVWKTDEPTVAPLAPPWVFILPEHIWKKYDGDLKAAKESRNVPAVGSGPFVLTEWKEGQFWTLERNPNYWGGDPAGDPTIDEVIYRVYDRSESMVQALRAGEVDFAESIQPSLFRSLEGVPGITTRATALNEFYNLAFGLWEPSLGAAYEGSQGEIPTANTSLLDPTVRIAIAKSIDKQTLVDKVLEGNGVAGSSVVFADSRWHWDPQAAGDTTQDYDPEAAKKMLDDAGYIDTDGDGIREDPKSGEPLEFTFLTITDMNYSVDNGEYIKGWLADIGMKVALKPVSQAKGYDLWYAHDYSGYHWSWGSAPDPDFILSIFTTGQCNVWSDGCYSNPEYDALYEQQRVAVDPDERAAIVDQMQKIVYDDVPEIVLFYSQDLQAYRSDRWTDFVSQPSPDGSVLFQFGNYSIRSIKPVAVTEGTDPASGSGFPWVIVAVALVLVVLLVVWMVRRRTDSEDRE